MRKIDQYAQEKFGGNVEAAIEFLLIGDHGDELTVEEAKFAMKIIRHETVASLKDKSVRELLHMSKLLDKMGMTQQQILATSQNPHTRQLLLYAGISTGVVLFILASFFLIPKSDWMITILKIVVYLGVVVTLARTLPAFINWRRFCTAKRLAKKHKDVSAK